jgi:sugar lactone lactonase YvrE
MRCLPIYTLTLAALTAPTLCHAQAGIITSVAGNGMTGFSGDGGPATSARLGGQPLGIAVDGAGNLYISDANNNRIRKVTPAGIITTVAGGGTAGLADGGPATSAGVPYPLGVAVDSAGNLYIAGAIMRKVNTSGIISTVPGAGSNVAVDGAGNLYMADILNHRILKLDTAGNLATIAGNGTQGYSGDGGPGTSAALFLPQGVAADSAGNVYFADNATRIRKVDTAGIISTVAGSGSGIGFGENIPALSSGMTPTFVAVDNAGNLYIADTGGGRIRKVNTAGIISTVAGGGLPLDLSFGDGGPATSASLRSPTGVAVDNAGNIYISDSSNRIRKVSAAPAISVGATSLSFFYTIGGGAPASQTLSIASTGAAFTFGVGASTSTGAVGWR